MGQPPTLFAVSVAATLFLLFLLLRPAASAVAAGKRCMALGPASPATVPLGGGPPSPPSQSAGGMYGSAAQGYENEMMTLRQQMFPAVLTTYGIPPVCLYFRNPPPSLDLDHHTQDSDRARSLAIFLGLQESPRFACAPARITYHQPWADRYSRTPPLLTRGQPKWREVPDDVLSHILAFEAVPRTLMWQWHNVSQQWRRCLALPLSEYFDFLRLCSLSLSRQENSVGSGVPAQSLVPRPFNVSIQPMKCMRCEKNSVVEQCSSGTMWGHCLRCSTDGQFDHLKVRGWLLHLLLV